MGAEAVRLLKQRFAIVNVWQPIRGPLRDASLAYAMPSVSSGDLIATDLVYRDRTGENYLMTYRLSHRSFYCPRCA